VAVITAFTFVLECHLVSKCLYIERSLYIPFRSLWK